MSIAQKAASSGPPFPATSAYNGLSVDSTGKIVLGNDENDPAQPAVLVSNREIPCIDVLGNFFNVAFRGSDDGFLNFTGASIDPVNCRVNTVGSSAGLGVSPKFHLTDWTAFGVFDQAELILFNQIIRLRHQAGLQYNFTIDQIANTISFGSNAGLMFQGVQTPGGGQYTIGDATNGFNQTKILINDLALEIEASSQNGRMMQLSNAASTYTIGDIDQLLNGTILSVDDINGDVRIENTAMNAGVVINGVNGFTGTVTPVTSITVDGGIVTNVT